MGMVATAVATAGSGAMIMKKLKLQQLRRIADEADVRVVAPLAQRPTDEVMGAQ